MKKFLSASILSANILRLEEEVRILEKSGVDFLHIDIMDGHFVPNINFGANLVLALKKMTHLPLDVHLMVSNPENHLQQFADAGVEILTVHIESTQHLHKTLYQIKQCGIKAGVALLPSTPHSAIQYVLDLVDLVLVMSVNPGFSGQNFIDTQIDKIKNLAKIISKDTLLAVDGGINDKILNQILQAGANFIVTGSYIYQGLNPKGQIDRLKNIFNISSKS